MPIAMTARFESSDVWMVPKKNRYQAMRLRTVTKNRTFCFEVAISRVVFFPGV
jgi:hypothetical protein